MVKCATGTFEVKVNPLEPFNKDDGATLGRLSIEKTFKGDLDAAGKGEMLTGGDPKSGSAGYVAMEQVAGTLHGKRGTFLLQHTGNMNRGEQSLSITVVPESGTGELSGISGRLSIKIENGKHFYEFNYTLPR
ncbi:MAG TPA: DUF3224 domain-containing protein [Gammaproteobacteria bacterium]|nr:DUF3224 domain-containing protein [Gammaproteobacteria bacterium]